MIYTQSISRIWAGDRVVSPRSVFLYVTEGESRQSTHPKLERRRVYPLQIIVRVILLINLISGVGICGERVGSSNEELTTAGEAVQQPAPEAGYHLKKKQKRKKCADKSQFIDKDHLIAKCIVVRKGIATMLANKGMSPATHPLIMQIERLLAELVAAPQVDALLLLQAGQCDGMGEAALALLPDSQPQLGVSNPALRPPSSRRSPVINDDQNKLLRQKAELPEAELHSGLVPEKRQQQGQLPLPDDRE